MSGCAVAGETPAIYQYKLRMPTGGRLTSWLFTSVEELNSGPPKTNPSSGTEKDLNPGPPYYNTSPALYH